MKEQGKYGGDSGYVVGFEVEGEFEDRKLTKRDFSLRSK